MAAEVDMWSGSVDPNSSLYPIYRTLSWATLLMFGLTICTFLAPLMMDEISTTARAAYHSNVRAPAIVVTWAIGAAASIVLSIAVERGEGRWSRWARGGGAGGADCGGGGGGGGGDGGGC